MSEDWKNDRAEAAMREGTEAIRKAAEEKAKQEADKEIHGEWKITVVIKGSERREILQDLINELVILEQNYNDANVKLLVVPNSIVNN
jgi:hypothetical protein